MNSSWWQSTTIYQIYPRSFADANDDGMKKEVKKEVKNIDVAYD